MNSPSRQEWSKKEKAVARRAFDLAHQRECDSIAAEVRTRAGKLSSPEDLWRLHGFLSERRREVRAKYDYRYSVLCSVFAGLIEEGWLRLEDLEGLGEDKIARIQQTLELWRRTTE